MPNDITLEVGMSHPNIIPLRKRLLELNILENSSISETFDDELLKSVLLFQENSGLVSDSSREKNISSVKSINRNQNNSSYG